MKTAIMSTFEEIMPKLSAVSDIGGDIERTFKAFARDIAGKKLVAPGVCMAYAIVTTRIATEVMATPMIAGIMYSMFPAVADSLFADDVEFANEVKAFFAQVVKDASQ